MHTCAEWCTSGTEDAVASDLQALGKVKVMQDKQVTRGGGNKHLTAVWSETHPHEIARVKKLLMRTAVFCEPLQPHTHPSKIPINTCWTHGIIFQWHIPVGIPGDDISIKARRNKQACVCVILYILHPAGMAVQWTHLWVQLSQVPQRNCGVIRTGGK